MAEHRYLEEMVVNVWKKPKDGKLKIADLLATLYWGDQVTPGEKKGKYTRVTLSDGAVGYIKGNPKLRETRLLELAFIDVTQGDACLIVTPDNKRVLVDGGENKLAARYLASRFQAEQASKGEVAFDAWVITHGDADHFAGLNILVLDAAKEKVPYKKIVARVKRLYHNGLVKRPSSHPRVNGKKGKRRKGKEMFGAYEVDANGKYYVTQLSRDPSKLGDKNLNKHFKRWKKAIAALRQRGTCKVERLDESMTGMFSFIDPRLKVDLLGPNLEILANGKSALPFVMEGSSPSASKTINGNSVVLRLQYDNVRFLLSGDLDRHVEEEMLEKAKHGSLELQSEVLKVPHHGSADYAPAFLRKVNPVISIISAGDENTRTDYLHPRANVLGALGKAGRGREPVIMITDLNAFDQYRGVAVDVNGRPDKWSYKTPKPGRAFYARERTGFGITHVRTDGKTLFVARRGSNPLKVEAYAYSVDSAHKVKPIRVTKR